MRALTGATLLAFAAQPALAQAAFELDEITFSANLAPTAVGSTGASVTIIERDELEAAGDVQLSGFLSRLPGVGVVQLGPLGTTSDLRIRGAHPRYVSVYVDGVLVTDPSSPSSNFNFGNLTTTDVGRIEVLRGSQGALYGGSAVGGVINITTREAEEEGLSHRATIEAGSYGTAIASYGLTQRTGQGSLTFNLGHTRTDGFSATEEADGNTEADGFESTRASVTLRHAVSDTLTLGASGFAQRSRAEYDFSSGDGDLVERRREIGGRIFAEFDPGAIRHVVDVTVYRINRRDTDAGGAPDRFRGTRIGASYLGTTEISEALRLSWGGQIGRERAEGQAPFTGFAPTSARTAAIYAEALWSPDPNLDISGSARVDRHSDFGTFETARLAMAWRATNALTVRGSISNGFRVPAFGERFGPFGNPALEAETSRSAEIGAEYALPGGGSLSATLFTLRTDDEITFGPPPTFTPDNIEQTNRRGLEVAGDMPLGERASLRLAYTYVDARFSAGPRDGLRLGRVPRHELALTVDTRVTGRLRNVTTMQLAADRLDRNGTNPMPSYALVNTSFRYEVTHRADFTLRIDNLFDKQYQTVAGYGTSDRAVYVGLSSRF
jgi:vitamin B12 transporter